MKKIYAILILSFLWINSSIANIVIPIHSWTTQIVAGYVIGNIFEKMGYPVKYVSVDSLAVYEKINKGEVSISHEVWDNVFGQSLESAIKSGGVIDAGQHAAFTQEDLGIPNWIIEKNLCPGLPDWNALKNPDCIKNFKNSKNKGLMLDGHITWHGNTFSERLEALGLNDLWKIDFAGDEPSLWAELSLAKSENRGIIIFNWTPNFTDREGFTMIKFPEYSEGCSKIDGGDGRCGSPKGKIRKAASKKFVVKYPEAFKAYQKINFTTLDIGTMAAYVDVDGMNHKEAANKWLNLNKHKWEYWIGKKKSIYDANKQQNIDQKY